MKRRVAVAALVFATAEIAPASGGQARPAPQTSTETEADPCPSRRDVDVAEIKAIQRALMDLEIQGQRMRSPDTTRQLDFVFVSTARPEDRALAEQVMQADEDFRRATLAADRSALARILSDDYIGVNPNIAPP